MTGKALQIVTFLMGQDREALWDLSPHKEKRSLSQNAYYWKLCGMTARKLKISTARLHNQLLRDVGAVETIGGQLVTVYLPDTDDSEEQVLEAQTYHLKPTSRVEHGRRCYLMLRGSHTFDTAQMGRLVDMMVEEAKAQGIETMTPDELAHMRALEAQREQKEQGV